MEKRFIVTIGREFGTGGRKIATELAQLLGVKLYDRQLLEPIREEHNLTQEEVDHIKAVKPSWWYGFSYLPRGRACVQGLSDGRKALPP